MKNRTKKLYVFLDGFTCSISAFVNPVITIYFIKLIDSDTIAVSSIIGLLLAANSKSLLQNDRFMRLAHKYYITINILSTVLYIGANFYGVEHPAMRYILLTAIGGAGFTVINAVMKDLINKNLHGSELTKLQLKAESVGLYAGVLGGVLALILHVDIWIAILLQTAEFIGCTAIEKILYSDLSEVELETEENPCI